MREISTKDLEVGEHIIVDGVEYVAEEDDGDCKGCDLFHCGRCFLIPCHNEVKLKRVEKQDGLSDFKPGPVMSLYEYPSLRDHFAMAAVTGFASNSVHTKSDYLAKRAYELADAMMEERKTDDNTGKD